MAPVRVFGSVWTAARVAAASVLLACLAGAPSATPVHAEALSLSGSTGPRVVAHRVIPGERLVDIAARYAVPAALIAHDNGLRGEHPYLRTGRTLQVRARRVPPPRRRINYVVRFGDSWRSIAARHGLRERWLLQWNPDVPRQFAAGQSLTLYVEQDATPVDTVGLGLDTDATGLSLPAVPDGGQSVGQPSRGRLRQAVQLPRNDAVYTIRRPEFAWGSSHAVRSLQLGLAKFRASSVYMGELVVSDMSPRRGGRYGGHRSHQSGRDVDVWLPEKRQVGAEASASPAQRFDWAATWELVRALVRTGEVQYIFLSRSRQRYLYRAARAAGEDVAVLGEVIQYPRRAQTGIVRDAPRHHHHLHVRFRCGPDEPRCR